MPKQASNEPEDDKREKPSVMSSIPKKKRSKKGNEIVRKKLEELGFTCIKPQKHYEDMICVKGNCRIPIQAKPLPLTRTNNQTCVDNPSLEDFVGLYVVWVERRNRPDAFLYIPDRIFRSIMNERGYLYSSVGRKRPHKDRWFLYIPRSLRDFEKFADDTIPIDIVKTKERLLRELK